MVRKLFVALLLLLLAAYPAMAGQGPNYEIWAGLLQRHVSGGVVDYAGFQAEEAELDRFLDSMARTEIYALDRTAQKALYINAYNAWSIKLILGKYPGVKTIKRAGGIFTKPWNKKFIRLSGERISLDDLEQKILMSRFKDPRVYFAISCAAKGSPPLLDRPYLPQTLDAQLNQAATAFINDPWRNYIKDRVLHLSSIFGWHSKDFGDDPAGFVLQYATGDFKRELAEIHPGEKIIYLEYDWSLNGK